MPKTSFGLPARLALYIGSIVLVTLPLLGLAFFQIAADPPPANTAAALALFFLFTVAAELRPVPVEAGGTSEVSVANVFIVATAVLFGWRYATPLASAAVVLALAGGRRELPRIAFNGAMYALAAAAAALPVELLGRVGHEQAPRLTFEVLAGGGLHAVVNVALVSTAIALAEGVGYRQVILPGLRIIGAQFAIMAFLAAIAVNLWTVNSWLVALLAGPLFTLTLYQRSARRSRLAAQDARTDNLTGLGNHRAYQAALRERIDDALRTGAAFSLCLLDLDNFKQINDVFGHPVGDDVLVRLSLLLREVGGDCSFRFGGDEFALLLAEDEQGAYLEMDRLQRRIGETVSTPSEPLTISVGIATFPAHAVDAARLQRTADGALIWAKSHGKNRSCVYSPGIVRIHTPQELEREAERNARLRAAKNLVRFVDARDPSTATHSEFVSELTEAIGIELELDTQTVDHLRLAGLLHDIGKIGVPDAILRAPRKLTAVEYEIVKRHPEFGYSLLDGLEIAPIEAWVLHHHEHWDGSGYPSGLAGEAIPLGSRIIHVADAFEAMTADRPYRKAQSREFALDELRNNAGTQFDPACVAALERHLATTHDLVEAFV